MEELKSILNEELGIEEKITLDSNLKEDLNIDSLLAMQLIILIEDKYNVNITEEEISKLGKVRDILNLLSKKGVNLK